MFTAKHAYVLSALVVLPGAARDSFADECTWPRKFKDGGYLAWMKMRATWTPRDRRPPPDLGVVRRTLELNDRQSAKKLTDAEKVELEVLSSGGSPREATLAVKKAGGALNPKEKTELEALQTTRNPRTALLAVKAYDGTLTKEEKAEFDVLKTTGVVREALLARAEAAGTLEPGDAAELAALRRSYGDPRYGYLANQRASGAKLSACDAQELDYIERSLGPAPAKGAPAGVAPPANAVR